MSRKGIKEHYKMYKDGKHWAFVGMSVVTVMITGAFNVGHVNADVKTNYAESESIDHTDDNTIKSVNSDNNSGVTRDATTAPTYKADLVGNTLGDGIPNDSNNANVKQSLLNLGITQQTVDYYNNNHKFNNDSMQMTYRVGLNSNYNYSQLKVVPEQDLVNDAPLRVLAAAYVSGDTVTSLPFVRNTDGSTAIDLSHLPEIGANSYVIYAIQPLNSSDDGSHMFLHSSSTSDFEIYGSDKSTGDQYVNGSQYVSEHPGWGTLWGTFNNRTKINMKSNVEISRGTNQSLKDFVNDYGNNSGGTFDVLDSEGKLISTTKDNFTFENDGTYYVKYYEKLDSGEYIWNTTKVVVAEHKAADVTVNYEDESGKEIATSETISGNIGDAYQAQQKQLDGYTFKEVKGNPTGKLTDEKQTVTYVYTKNPVKAADVTVNYEDESGKEIATSETISGNIGDDYHAQQKQVDGYTFKEVKGNPTGKLTDEKQTVTYVYTKNPVKAADVTVNYEDESGKEIATSETISGNIGDDYHAQQKQVDGYTFKEVKGNPTGKLTDEKQTVTYVYTKDSNPKNAEVNGPKNENHNQVNQTLSTTKADNSSTKTKQPLTKKIQDGVNTILPNTAAKQKGYVSVISVLAVLTGILIYFKKRQ